MVDVEPGLLWSVVSLLAVVRCIRNASQKTFPAYGFVAKSGTFSISYPLARFGLTATLSEHALLFRSGAGCRHRRCLKRSRCYPRSTSIVTCALLCHSKTPCH